MSSKQHTCDRCQHYRPSGYKDAGRCVLMGDSNDYPYDPDTDTKGFAPDRAYGWDYEGYNAGVYVTPKFGCIHWGKKGEGMSTEDDEFNRIEREASMRMAAVKTTVSKHQCDWPACQSEQYQQALAEQIKQELVTGVAQTARWYCIDKIGVATLCADEEDAIQNARQAEKDWPNNAPYRAVQLCELAR